MPVSLLRCLLRSLNARKRLPDEVRRRPALGLSLLALLAACSKTATPEAVQPVDITVMTVAPHDTPVDFEFVAQTQSSRAVEIRARVDGFLDKRAYTEGQMVREGQTLFLMDPKPFEAALQSAQGALAQQQARLEVAKANLARVTPLAAQNALSKKDLDDAIGGEHEAQAAVIAAKGQVQTARLNLGYTTIRSPLTGLSSYARQQDGSYVTPAQSGLLTYVYQMDPMWVEFSISENEMLRYRDEIAKGRLRFPADNQFDISLLLADGSTFPARGRIAFANPVFSAQTGTFLVRAVFANEKGSLRPGQFVRAKVSGAVRPNAVLLPQRAVQQGAKSHFVWTLDKDDKPHQRFVEIGEWLGDDSFIDDGLHAGERVVVDGAIRLSPDARIRITGAVPAVAQPAIAPLAAQQDSEHHTAH
ncbi:efflux RND transporter periplasmic adaptor subunit [Paraburkholderia sp. BL17N1]|uniref:efflux RND transporter periplasmic adaptor subunit n=1 Tax=Paraburkholderia sp. BL17N1 TaxID=1938798 RepID=UPI000EB5A8A1|nr:efflux RND transporter periplasmic adaptor subunit [Paraburkholderia sp. BL17N1]RKR39047.1 membrane fusion protein (multidrug efflux system) [Paraburkholderia sp. BL17N1]